MINEHGRKWGRIADALERPADECRNRYNKCFVQMERRRQGMDVLTLLLEERSGRAQDHGLPKKKLALPRSCKIWAKSLIPGRRLRSGWTTRGRHTSAAINGTSNLNVESPFLSQVIGSIRCTRSSRTVEKPPAGVIQTPIFLFKSMYYSAHSPLLDLNSSLEWRHWILMQRRESTGLPYATKGGRSGPLAGSRRGGHASKRQSTHRARLIAVSTCPFGVSAYR
jgi:hypothetical protein